MKLPRSAALRFPASADEDDLVHGRWDRLNGRYYVMADVVLADGRTFEATFDADTNIAVEVGRRRIPAELFGAAIVECRLRTPRVQRSS